MIFVVTQDAWRSSHVGANSDWLLQLSGNLYWGSKLVMTCRVQAQQQWVPWCLSVVCNGWKGMLHVQGLSSSLAVYSTNRTDSWAPRRAVARWREPAGLGCHSWKQTQSPVQKEQASSGPQSWGGRKERKGWEGCKLPQSSTTQAHIWFSMKQQSLLHLSPRSFPEHVRSRWRLIAKWQNFPIDLPWLEFWRNITHFLGSKVS